VQPDLLVFLIRARCASEASSSQSAAWRDKSAPARIHALLGDNAVIRAGWRSHPSLPSQEARQVAGPTAQSAAASMLSFFIVRCAKSSAANGRVLRAASRTELKAALDFFQRAGCILRPSESALAEVLCTAGLAVSLEKSNISHGSAEFS
jgi:hypothetical protein